MEAIQVVFEELRKKGHFSSVHMCLRSDTIGRSDVCFVKSGNLEWLDKNKSRCLVMWRRPEEWGKLIYQWVSGNTPTARRGLPPLSSCALIDVLLFLGFQKWDGQLCVYTLRIVQR